VGDREQPLDEPQPAAEPRRERPFKPKRIAGRGFPFGDCPEDLGRGSPWPTLAPPGFGARHSRGRPRCRSLEVSPLVGRSSVSGVIGSVVVAEVPLPSVRHQAKDAEVQIGHDRTPRPGIGIDTAAAWGSPSRRSSNTTAGVNRSRERGQHGWVAGFTAGSFRAGSARTPGIRDSSRGCLPARH
jgi:hypothetical protein